MKFINNPEPVTRQEYTDRIKPVVSIACLVFNHENYIRDTLNGFLMQETSFPIEILVHDDASTDKSAEIIREYEAKYPEIILPIYQTENQYSRGNKPGRINRQRAKGKYIALCEGDDFWTDPLKLQKQVEFLEKNSDYSMVCTNFSVVDEKKNMIEVHGWSGNKTKPHINQKIILERYTPKILTALIRRECLDKIDPDFFHCRFPNGDMAFFAAITEFGPCYFMNEITGCYRQTSTGIWAGKDLHDQLEMKFTTLNSLISYFSKKREARKSIYKRLINTTRVLSILSFKKAAPINALKYVGYYIYYNMRLALHWY